MKFVRDPTSEASATKRPPKALPDDITGKTIATIATGGNVEPERFCQLLTAT